MRRIFLDANVVVDFMDASATDHQPAYECVRIIRRYFGKPVVSPCTFIIANYLFGKISRNKEQHRNRMQFVFAEFLMASIEADFLANIFESPFRDLEDAAQYQSALQSAAELIITKDIHHYFPAQIPVVHPHDFVNRFLDLLS